MKIRTFILSSIVLGVFLWQSCSNDLDLTAPWQDIPVVYGIIDITEDTHYIRVQKAFLDPETSAVELAQVSDSIYYANIDVSLKVNDDQTFNLTKINGEDEGIGKDAGAFANSPNVLYKISQADINLKEGDVVELMINRGDNLPTVTAKTIIVGNSDVRTPGTGFDGEKTGLSFRNNVPTSIRWTASEFGVVYDLKLFFTYEEYLFTNPDDRDSFTIVLPVNRNILNDGEFSIGVQGPTGITGQEFYGFVASNIPVKEGYQRRFKRIDIQVTGGSNEILETFKIEDANTGLTSAQDIPLYTNLSEGRGYFASRNQLIDGRILLPSSRDSLANGQQTKDLNFLQ